MRPLSLRQAIHASMPLDSPSDNRYYSQMLADQCEARIHLLLTEV